eukprot:1183687-Prorocentrum_minimum.AAC.1
MGRREGKSNFTAIRWLRESLSAHQSGDIDGGNQPVGIPPPPSTAAPAVEPPKCRYPRRRRRRGAPRAIGLSVSSPCRIGRAAPARRATTDDPVGFPVSSADLAKADKLQMKYIPGNSP